MSLKGMFGFVIPATIAVMFTVSIDVGQFVPICVFSLVVLLLLLRTFTGDVGLFSLVAVVIAVVVSIFCTKRSICTVDKLPPEIKVKKLRKPKKEVIANQDKKKRKERKKKRPKTMEEDKENVPNMPVKTKVYETLKEFTDLPMGKEHLYHSMHRYVLNPEQLVRNRYPVPGILSEEVFSSEGVVCRKCCRCKKIFHVALDGSCKNNEECVYHPHKSKLVGGVHIHECCRKPFGSPGCQTYSRHVCAKPVLHNVTFQNVREKRQIRAEQQQQVYAVDCEMVYTNLGLQVAKIGIVNLEGLTIYESYVQPDNEIIDYNTTYSGITPKDLKGINTTLSDVQTYLDQLLNQDTILIGHGLESDLKTLRIMHNKVIDTAVLFPRKDGTKQKLRDLAKSLLNQTIQNDPCGHDCIEDARTCMALVLYKVKKDNEKFCSQMHRHLDMQKRLNEQCFKQQQQAVACNSYYYFSQLPNSSFCTVNY